MIFINLKLDCKIEKCISDKSGRYIVLDVLVHESGLILVNIYAPIDLSQQSKFFRSLHRQLQDFSHENVVIGDDFNCALSDKDKKGGKAVAQKASVIKEIEELCTFYNLVDIWHRLNCLSSNRTLGETSLTRDSVDWISFRRVCYF